MNPLNLDFYQNLYLARKHCGIYTPRIDTRKKCLTCQRFRLAGYLTNKGFICCICLDLVNKTAKKKGVDLNIIEVQKEVEILENTEDNKDFKLLFKAEIIQLLTKTDSPLPIRLGLFVFKQLIEKGLKIPKHFSVTNYLTTLRKQGYSIPKKEEIREDWTKWTTEQIRLGIAWERIFSICQEKNLWTDRTMIEYIRSLAEEMGEGSSLSSFLHQRTVETQNTNQLELKLAL